MNNRPNNYHFGRHVFDYFPWYKYDNLDLNCPPKMDKQIWESLKFAFQKSSAIYLWNISGPHLYASFSYVDDNSIFISCENDESVVQYSGIVETVYDWEDVEKARLRNILGREKEAKEYMKIVDFYNSYYNEVSDMIYSQIGEDLEIPIVTKEYIYNVDENACLNIISNDDIYRCLKSGKFEHSRFLDSIYSYYNSRGFLTERQLEDVKKCMAKDIVSTDKDPLLFIKTTLFDSSKRVSSYISEIGLDILESRNFIAAYKKENYI